MHFYIKVSILNSINYKEVLALQRTLVVYNSRFGTTYEIAKKIALILGPSKVCKCDEKNFDIKDYDFIVFGTPVYNGSIDENIIKFILKNYDLIKGKKCAAFCCCINQKDKEKYFKPLKEVLGESLIYIESIDNKNIDEIIDFALKLKHMKEDMLTNSIPKAKLKFYIEEFLNCHTTCTLSTSSYKRVRGTPIEYNYKNNHIYLLTEGGEKFCNLLKNCSVSLSIYDNFQGMGKLAGMQIDGQAFLIDEKSREYKDILNLKGVSFENIIKLPITMNIIKIKLLKAEFIYYKFKSLGYDSKQIYYFDK